MRASIRPGARQRAETARDLILRPWAEQWGQPLVGAQVGVRVDLEDLEQQEDATRPASEPAAPHVSDPAPAEEAGAAIPGDPPSGSELPGSKLSASVRPGSETSQKESLSSEPSMSVPPTRSPGGCTGGSGRAPTVDRLPVTAAAVRALLARLAALDLDDPPGGSVVLELCAGDTGQLQAAVTLRELAAAGRAGTGLGPPPARDGYTPSAAQRRFVHARDQHCRFPGCRRPARFCDIDHVCPFDCGGTTNCPNLCCLCRRHHRLKTHAVGWVFRMDPDGTLHVTTPTGITRTTRPPAMDDPVVDVAEDPPPF